MGGYNLPSISSNTLYPILVFLGGADSSLLYNLLPDSPDTSLVSPLLSLSLDSPLLTNDTLSQSPNLSLNLVEYAVIIAFAAFTELLTGAMPINLSNRVERCPVGVFTRAIRPLLSFWIIQLGITIFSFEDKDRQKRVENQ